MPAPASHVLPKLPPHFRQTDYFSLYLRGFIAHGQSKGKSSDISKKHLNHGHFWLVGQRHHLQHGVLKDIVSFKEDHNELLIVACYNNTAYAVMKVPSGKSPEQFYKTAKRVQWIEKVL